MDGEQAIFDGQHGHRVVATRTKTQEWFSPSIDGGIRPARRRGASPGTLGPPRRSVCELSSLGIHWGAHRSLFRGTVASWDGRFVGRSLRGTVASWDGRFVGRSVRRGPDAATLRVPKGSWFRSSGYVTPDIVRNAIRS